MVLVPPIIEEPELPVEEHSHYPDTSKAHTMTTKDGKVVQKFICAVCGETVELVSEDNLIDESIAESMLGVTQTKTINVGKQLNSKSEPYVISFDFSVNSANIENIAKAGLTGASLLEIGKSAGALAETWWMVGSRADLEISSPRKSLCL